jgi:adenosylhomocysteine nucleosidase
MTYNRIWSATLMSITDLRRLSRGIALLALGLGALTGPAFAETLDDTPRIAVISAFAPEWGVLRDEMDAPVAHRLHGATFLTGTLGDKPVVVFLSGISMVNAAMTTQMALDHFNVAGIVFSGIAGGADPDLSIGDVAVPRQWSQYLESIMARETPEGFVIPPWMKKQGANLGMIFPKSVGVVSARQDTVEERMFFPVDPAYLEVATKVAGEVELEKCDARNACLDQRPRIVVGGGGVSGQSFVDNAELRQWAHDTFGARVIDVESAAVAHVAYVNEVPFIAFRSLSDLAGGGAGANEMATFMSLAATNSARVVVQFLADLPNAPAEGGESPDDEIK